MSKSKHSLSVVEQIESRSKRSVTIATDLNEDNLSKCDQQDQSELFSLPLEIREIIWHYATTPYDDPEFASSPLGDFHHITFHPSGEFYDPSYTAGQVSSVALLQTCRRVWLETNRLPLEKAKLSCASLSGADRMKPFRRDAQAEYVRLEDLFFNLTPNNLQNLSHITMFVNHFSIMNPHPSSRRGRTGCEKIQGSLGPCPRIITISARTNSNSSAAGPTPVEWRDWVGMLLRFPASPRLQEITVQIEVSNWAASKRDDVVGRIRVANAIIQREDQFGQPAVLQLEEESEETKWSWTDVAGETKERQLVTLMWKITSSTLEATEFRVKKHSTGLTHDCGSSLPLLVVDPFSSVDQNSASTGPIDRIEEQYQEKWKLDGSLLKFAPDSHR